MQKTKASNQSYSSYWLDLGEWEDSDDVALHAADSEDAKVFEADHMERIVKLASVRRAIANFVRILTNNPEIKIEFSSGEQSYTNGKTVVIAADVDSLKFDPMVGLALHEGAHCLLSDFDFLNNVIAPQNRSHTIRALKPELRDRLDFTKSDTLHAQTRWYQKTLALLINIIEDRRIDSFVYKTAPGYRPYYDAMYTKYFFNSDVEKNMRHNPEWRDIDVDNYICWLVQMFHPAFDRNALPGLSRMVDMIDLENIRRFDIVKKMPHRVTHWPVVDISGEFAIKNNWAMHVGAFNIYQYDELPLIWRVANDILDLMLNYVAVGQLRKSNTMENALKSDSCGNTITVDGLSFNVDGNELQNFDMNSSSVTPVSDGRYNANKGKKALDKIKSALEGQPRRKKITQKERKDVDLLEAASAKIVEGGDKITGSFPCLVLRKVTQQVMESNVFPFTYLAPYAGGEKYKLEKFPNADAPILSGIRMGQILVNRLQVRNDPTITHFTRQSHGKIDRRILAQLGMDIETVFKRTTVENFKPAMLHLSLDASGSMGDKKWDNCMTVATALAYVSKKIQNIDVIITLRGESSMPVVAVVFDSRVDTFQKVRHLFPYFRPRGSTPEGLCFKATLDLITELSTTHDTYFINFSDGEPGYSLRRRGIHYSYTGQMAIQHTRRQVNLIREAGVKVLSYFISESAQSYTSYYDNSRSLFKKMYGEDAQMINVNNTTDVLRTLNKLLLSDKR